MEEIKIRLTVQSSSCPLYTAGDAVVFDGPLIAKDESANICMMAMNAVFPFVYAARKGILNHGPFQCPDCADKVEFRIERA